MAEVGEIPIPEDVSTVVIFGGTFDPPTRAHAALALAARESVPEDDAWLLVIPAARSPFKETGALASDEQRIEMLRLAFEGQDRVGIAKLELGRGGASYTVESLREIHRERPNATLRLVMGADQAASFHEWKEPHAILAIAQPIVLRRREHAADDEQLLAKMASHWNEEELRSWAGWLAEAPAMPGSASEVRAILASGAHDDARLEELLDPEVLGYIRSGGLYTGAPQRKG